ncbi:zinc transporter ZIP10 [Nematostella vectensis]|uniref:zinc transporter ZIP10 n=1 Tax=Nematostella vectensis TaxID=45351 RepID=UPI002076E3AE|nr:zinc transporter ZIP10 [Nematostella vectensis]XP_032240303.2 zinc transporter ZIP10 [Nematostella vectensis]
MVALHVSVVLGVCLWNIANCYEPREQATNNKWDRVIILKNATEHFVEEIFEQYAVNNSIGYEKFRDLLKKLRIEKTVVDGSPSALGQSTLSPKDSGFHNSHYSRQRRESFAHVKDSGDTEVHNSTGNSTRDPHHHTECLPGDELLKVHSIDAAKGINRKEFVQLCPSLVFQVQSGICIGPVKFRSKSSDRGSNIQIWGYGLLSITIISLSSLLAIAIIPLLGKAAYAKIMSFLVALAIGTLSGDALLHLIPHTFVDSHGGHSHSLAVYKALVIVAGIYAFFLVESFMRLRNSRRHHHHHHHSHNGDAHHHHHHDHQNSSKECQTSLTCHSPCGPSDPLIASRLAGNLFCRSREDIPSPITSDTLTELSNLGSLECGKEVDANAPLCDKVQNWGSTDKPPHSFSDADLNDIIRDNSLGYVDIYRKQTFAQPCLHQDLSGPQKRTDGSGSDVSSGSDSIENEKFTLRDDHTDNHHQNHHDHHHHHHHDKKIDSKTSIATVAWMVIVSDGFHNLSDGLAVGAAFSSSLTNGMTTAIAVFCHELPHELGDFAILIKSGLTFKQALAYNMASAVISFLGLIIGILIGNMDTSHSWVLALTAGMFLYISLVSMLPELCSYQEEGSWGVFLSQNIGILTGILIMLTIALLE